MVLIIKHIDTEGPGTLGDFFENTQWETRVIELNKNEVLPPVDSCEAIITLGGPMNVYEEGKYPFLKDEDRFLKRAIKEGVPILGICLGAQLLAKAVGAKVKKAEHKEIGWHSVNLTDDGRKDSLFQGLSDSLSVFQWHEDTFELPRGAKLLATSRTCHNQAFRFGRNAYGLQFHLEVNAEMIDSWIKEYQVESKEFDVKDMLIETYRNSEPLKKLADVVYFNFAKVITSSYNVSMA
jgi:GMP synthase-like glutamine amidotransferase